MQNLQSCQHRKIADKKILKEVIIIRLVLIVCLVLFHSFAPYSNDWTPLTDEFIAPYYWTSKFSNSFFLGSFVFVSGYLYAYSDLIKGPQSLGTVIKRKGSRLIIPSIVLSILYLAIFGLKDGETVLQAIYSIIEGRGHMWFLPMLFWLFIIMEVIKRIKLSPALILVISFILTAGAILPLPMRLNWVFKYMIFFYLGYIIKTVSNDNLRRICKGDVVVISLLVWLCCFVCVECLSLYYTVKGTIISKLINVLIYYGKIVYTIAGTIFIFVLAINLINKYHINISDKLVKISGLCFGVYLYHQFILIYIYYHTSFVAVMGIFATPWFGFIITLIVSIILSYLTMRTRLGRALIG